ncbi:hypothetical protein F4826_004792 [Rahnella inusitata]|nr:hypothetical protein [Rahnella inusitata]
MREIINTSSKLSGCITAAVFSMIASTEASASVYTDSRYDSCFVKAGKEFSIDPLLLKAIGIQESTLNNGAINRSSPRYPDYSLMQISGWWLNKPYFVQNKITRDTLLKDPCLSIRTGTWILAGNFALNGVNWESVGAYNAGFSKEAGYVAARKRYIGFIQNHLHQLKGHQDNTIIAQVSDKLGSLPVSELRATFSGGAHNYRFEKQTRSFAFDIVMTRDLGMPGKLVGGIE